METMALVNFSLQKVLTSTIPQKYEIVYETFLAEKKN